MTLTERLKAHIESCDDGDGIPAWCVATGKCTCARAKDLLDELAGVSDEVRGLAEIAFQMGADIHGKD